MSDRDDFYIGWEDRAQASVGRAARLRTLALLALVPLLAIAVALAHGPSAVSRFEFGVARTFEGHLEHVPYPTLVIKGPDGSCSRWLLTVFGKHGAEPLTRPLDGHRVRVEGSLLYRDAWTMVEVASLEDLGPATAGPDSRAVEAPFATGLTSLRGEIVDSKCWMGTMKPGALKAHRACAANCIAGGVPPLLIREDGPPVLLAGPNGEPLGAALAPWIAEPVEVRGELADLGGLAVLHTDVEHISRAPLSTQADAR